MNDQELEAEQRIFVPLLEHFLLPPAGPLPELAPHLHQPLHQVASHYQPHQPVPHGQQQQHMHPARPSIPPHGPVPGAEQVAVQQPVRNTRPKLATIVQAACRVKAGVGLREDALVLGLREDALVPPQVTKRRTAAVEVVTEAGQMMEQGMQGLDWVSAMTAPGPALPPQLRVQAPPDIAMSWQARSILQQGIFACQSIVRIVLPTASQTLAGPLSHAVTFCRRFLMSLSFL